MGQDDSVRMPVRSYFLKKMALWVCLRGAPPFSHMISHLIIHHLACGLWVKSNLLAVFNVPNPRCKKNMLLTKGMDGLHPEVGPSIYTPMAASKGHRL